MPPLLEERETDLHITGMTCASCVSHVARALKHVPGVTEARVNLVTEQALVRHSADTSVAALKKAVERAGYEAAETRSEDLDALARKHESSASLYRLLFGFVLFAPALVLGMLPISFASKDWVMALLAFLAWSIVGFPFHRSALIGLRHGSANMDTLVSLGSTAALGYSLHAMSMMQPTYFETVVAIVVLITLGKYLETSARARTNVALRKLLALRPTTAFRESPAGSVEEVSVDALLPDDIVRVKPGERIPIDGIITQGQSAVNAAMLTGEPIPQEVAPGSAVSGGTINGDGALRVRVTAVGSGTALAHIIRIVQEAQGSQAPIQRLADRVAGIFVPIIIGVAILTFLGWIASGHAWWNALPVAIAVLVVACPCAMGLATPTAVMVAVGQAAQHGILFKDAQTIERTGHITHVVFDKTGTLTQGKPEVVDIACLAGWEEYDLLRLAAAVERESTHPLARAVAAAARQRDISVPPVHNARTERGAGASGEVENKNVLVGTQEYLAANGVSRDAFTFRTSPPKAATLVWVAVDGHPAGRIAFLDTLRTDALEALKSLRSLGISIALVSGDTRESTEAVAETLGIHEARSRALPEEKAAYIKETRARGACTAFVGDGINDAPALASADVGFAMSGGSEIALETAGATILSNDLQAIPGAIRLSRSTNRTIAQNLFWAFAYNIVLVPLAAFGLVRPIYAAGAMALSSLFVVGNSLLLRYRA